MRTLLVPIVLLAASGPAPALACSALIPCLQASSYPANGAVGIARNARPTVSYGGLGRSELPGPSGIVLRAEGGQPVSVQIQRLDTDPQGTEAAYELVPDAPLDAQTVYELVVPVGALDADTCLSHEGEPTVLSRFTTGSQSDESAPSIVGTPSVTVSARWTETDEAACGPYDGCLWTVRVDAVSDDSGRAWLTVDEPWPRRTGTEVTSWNGTSIDPTVRESIFESLSVLTLGAGTHSLTAIDGAGNRSAPVAFTVPECEPDVALPGADAGPLPDAGDLGQGDAAVGPSPVPGDDGGPISAPSSPDAGADGEADSSTKRGGDGSCSLQPSARGTVWPLSALTVLGLLRARRRRAARTRGVED